MLYYVVCLYTIPLYASIIESENGTGISVVYDFLKPSTKVTRRIVWNGDNITTTQEQIVHDDDPNSIRIDYYAFTLYISCLIFTREVTRFSVVAGSGEIYCHT